LRFIRQWAISILHMLELCSFQVHVIIFLFLCYIPIQFVSIWLRCHEHKLYGVKWLHNRQLERKRWWLDMNVVTQNMHIVPEGKQEHLQSGESVQECRKMQPNGNLTKFAPYISKCFHDIVSSFGGRCTCAKNPVTHVSMRRYMFEGRLSGNRLWSNGLSSWLQIQRFRVRFPALPDFQRIIGSGTRSTQSREDNWGAILRK
jgi:hypothetical protein